MKMRLEEVVSSSVRRMTWRVGEGSRARRQNEEGGGEHK